MRLGQRFLTLFLLSVSLPLAAQTPDWLETASRKVHYPPVAWYTGFVAGEQKNNETQEDAYARLKNEARAELVASIRTTVQQNIAMHSRSDLQQTTESMEEQIQETYTSETRIQSGISDIPGLNVDTWRSKDGTIYAFACIKRATLRNQLIKRLTLGLSKAEGILEQTEQLAADGKKVEAMQMLQKGSQLLHEAEDAQTLLGIVDDSADEETLESATMQTLQKRYDALMMQLKNAVSVYLNCDAALFGEQYKPLEGKVRGELSQMGVTFVSAPEQSDWAIYITASAREHNSRQFGTMTTYTAYVDATIAIEKTKSGQRIFDAQTDAEKGTSTVSFAEAARDAYKQLSPKISETIKQQIQ